MNTQITTLEPSNIWKNFYQLTQIPRPSKHEAAIQDFMVDFGNKLGLETIKDETGNIIIRKPATAGKESCKGVILQGHLDMVPQKNSETAHSFETDSITTYVDGDWVTAQDTTLGADNGIGVAMAMAVLQSTDIEHGPIECLFTADEETGMTGAFGLKPDLLQGEILLNLDSEDEGEIFIGCAGGVNVLATFNYKTEEIPTGYSALEIALTGLKGGHSGVDIHLGRGNANKLMNRVLKAGAEQFGLQLAEINGGSLRNAIPRESFAKIIVPEEKVDETIAMIADCELIFKNELADIEPDLSIKTTKIDLPKSIIDSDTQNKLLRSISGCINDVIRMSNDMKGVVETSSNLASIKSADNKIIIECLVRSSVESAKDDVADSLKSIFSLAGAKVEINGGYPGWKPNMDSAILALMRNTYKEMYDKAPKVTAIHAGLECGLLGSVYPNWDMVSFGPTIRFPHSPDEKVHIESVSKTWKFLVAILKKI